MQALCAELEGLRAITGAQGRHGQTVMPGRSALKFARATIAGGSVEVVGEIDGIARSIGRDPPAQFDQSGDIDLKVAQQLFSERPETEDTKRAPIRKFDAV